MATATDFLMSYIEPLAEALTPDQAKKILAAQPPKDLIAKVHEWADKANAGTLTELERIEYECYVDIDDIIGLLKARARDLLGLTVR